MNLSDAFIKKDKSEKQIMPYIETDTIICDRFYTTICSPNVEVDLPKYVIDSTQKLLESAVVKRNPSAIQILVDGKFLTVLKDCISNSTLCFEETDRNRMNRVCYDYNRMSDHNIFIQNLLLSVVVLSNNKIAQVLMGYGLSLEQAGSIIAARYSTANDIRTNYKRIIRTIQSMPENLMDKSTILKILGKTCNKSVRDLFIACMLDKYTQFYSSEEENVYYTVSLAVLDIVESMTMDDIRTILNAYMQAQTHSNKQPRFQLKSISLGDYPRINQQIDLMEMSGTYIY